MTMEEYLLHTFGAAKGSALFAATRQGLSALDELCTGESEARAKTMREKILPRIALYRALQADGMPREKAYDVVWDYTKTCVCAPMRRQYGKLEHIPFFFFLYRKIFLHVISTSDNWDTKVTQDAPETFGFEIHKCLWNDTCHTCGCPELCRIFCDSDWENFGDMKKTKFARTETLGTGGTMCDFTFARCTPQDVSYETK